MFVRLGFKTFLFFLVFLGVWVTGIGATIQVFIRLEPRDSQFDIVRLTLSRMETGEALRSVNLIDDKGYAFSGVRSGSYLIRAESPGFLTSEIQVELNSFSRADHMLTTVILQKDPNSLSELPETGKDTVSVSTLAIPSGALDQMDKARKASRKGDSLDALAHLKQAIEIYPRLYQAYNNMAVEYARLERLEEAARALEKSISIQPDDATTYRNLAQIYLTVGRLNKAADLINRSLELDPGGSKSLDLLGKLHIRLGNYQTALNHFYQASERNKNDHSHIGIGECLTLLGRYREALVEFKAFVSLFPKDPRTSGVQTVIARLETDLHQVEP